MASADEMTQVIQILMDLGGFNPVRKALWILFAHECFFLQKYNCFCKFGQVENVYAQPKDAASPTDLSAVIQQAQAFDLFMENLFHVEF